MEGGGGRREKLEFPTCQLSRINLSKCGHIFVEMKIRGRKDIKYLERSEGGRLRRKKSIIDNFQTCRVIAETIQKLYRKR